MKVGILGAVSYEPIIEREVSRTDVRTRFGDVSVLEGMVGDATVYYIRRFGPDNDMRSDIVNHAAHALAFRQLGVRRVITLNGFGIVNRDFDVGDLVVYDDYIRMCERFPTTVFSGDKGWFRANMNLPLLPRTATRTG
jgi:purine nucleoside phosphorylase